MDVRMTDRSTRASPEEALHRAVEALVAGAHDARHVEGAQANALESIAWSLVGLLAEKVEPEGSDRETLSEGLQSRGLLGLDRQR